MKKLRMKKIFHTFLILALALSMTGCGEYFSAVRSPNGEETQPVGGGTSADLRDDPTAFTVSIRYDGEPYIPKKKDEMKAQWTDGFSVYVADFDTEDGFARVAGLDGDYRVTLEGLPSGYVYDPNFYTATNDARNIIIDIYKPIRTSGYGTGMWDCIKISKTGVYRVELKDANHKVFFEYAPDSSGTYSVESWMGIAEGQYNPMVDVYTGSIAYKTFSYTLNDGGYCEGYTQNFKHIVEIADEQISDGGQAVFTFAVFADSKNNSYPVYLDIAVKLNGSFELDGEDHYMVIPQEDFRQTPEYSPTQYRFVWAETSTKGVEGRYQFDGSMFKLFEKDEDIDGDDVGDGDGYYHVYDETRYASNGGYGPILYAKISQACRFIDLPFTSIEDPGNKVLTVNGNENHKHFIEGYGSLLRKNYYCVAQCPCRTADSGACGGACEPGCTKCHEECRQCPAELKGKGGYADYCNSDGVYAVTEELKYFLQSYSVSQRMFADGNGWVEENPTIKVDAKEADQWLFACGYYVEIG